MFKETRQALADFMGHSRKSQRQLSKETGLSTSVISQFLNGTYTGDNEEVAKTIDQYLAVGKERLNSVSDVQFVEKLYNTQEVLFACNYAHRNNDITLVSGDAGAGKTTALKYYAEHNTGVIFVTANACITTATAILSLICRQIGRQVPTRRAALMNTLVEPLTGTNRLIIIDEADYLLLDALQAVRNLNDTAHCGIVLSGNDKIYRQMLSPRRGYEFEQIRTRIIVRKKVFNEYTVEEMQAMFPSLNRECIGYMLKLACAESLRTAKKLCEVAKEVANAKKEALSVKHLRDTQKQLLGEVMA